MLHEVDISQHITQKEVLQFFTKEQKDELYALLETMEGKSVLHINATDRGGGVAELLASLVPYLRVFGIKSSWHAIDSEGVPPRFFTITNLLHNALQGAEVSLTDEDWQIYEEVNTQIAKALQQHSCDVLVVHDPQPLFAGVRIPDVSGKVYISHIDTSTPQEDAWERILPRIVQYDRIFFSNHDFVNARLPDEKLRVFTPAIDPLAPKQKIIPQKKARAYLSKFGIPTDVPLVVQVSRFDVWKNPLGVIEAFHIIQQTHPDIHLALVGFQEAKDNPAAEAVYNDVVAIAEREPNIHLFFTPGDIDTTTFTVMAQSGADVVVQNSLREGFGLTTTEALWKKKPVVGGPASGIRRQITHGVNGYITTSPDELARHVVTLLGDADLRISLGEAGHERVYKDFLFPRFVLDHMREYAELVRP